MKISILMLTCDRPGYTRITLGGLLDSIPPFANVSVWDNASGPETRAVIAEFADHPRMKEVVYSETNQKLREPTNWFWSKNADADFVSKIDDDCLHKPGWCEALLQTHAAFSESGVIGTWRFYPADTIEHLPVSKILSRNSVSILRNCWVQGSGYLMRTAVIQKQGLLREKESFPAYCVRAAAAGYLNGFAYPFVFEDHFDDPRSAYSQIETDADLTKRLPLSAESFRITTVADWIEHQKHEARIVQLASCDPFDHIGLGARVKRKLFSLAGRRYIPKAR